MLIIEFQFCWQFMQLCGGGGGGRIGINKGGFGKKRFGSPLHHLFKEYDTAIYSSPLPFNTLFVGYNSRILQEWYFTLIFVCEERSSALLMGESIFAAVKKAENKYMGWESMYVYHKKKLAFLMEALMDTLAKTYKKYFWIFFHFRTF